MFSFNINIVNPYKSTVRKPLFKLYYSMRSYFCFNRILAGVIALLLLATIFYACGKTTNDVAPSNNNDNQSIGAAANEAAVSGIYSDLFNVAVEISASMGLSETGRIAVQRNLTDRLGNCYTPDVDDVTIDRWPKVVTVDFGSGCPDASGRSRAGILKLTYTGYLKYPGATVTIEPVTYAVNGISIKGKKVITNMSSNELYKYGVKVTGGIIKLDTVSIGYSSNFTVIQTAGANTSEGVDDLMDDVYAFSGSDTLTYPGSLVAITNIGDSTALIRKMDCPYIGQGKAMLTLKSAAATINYGNGVCDDSAMISIGDKVKTIGLPK